MEELFKVLSLKDIIMLLLVLISCFIAYYYKLMYEYNKNKILIIENKLNNIIKINDNIYNSLFNKSKIDMSNVNIIKHNKTNNKHNALKLFMDGGAYVRHS